MALLLLFLFIAVPLGELTLLLWIADKTHWLFPVGLVVATGALGVVLLRLQGILTLRRVQNSFSATGEPPTDPLIDAGLMLFAAGLLLTPGVITDALGLSLLFPPTRLLWRNSLKRWFRQRFQMVAWHSSSGDPEMPDAYHHPPGDGDDVVEGHVVKRPEDE